LSKTCGSRTFPVRAKTAFTDLLQFALADGNLLKIAP
jgi:hypothetical protein